MSRKPAPAPPDALEHRARAALDAAEPPADGKIGRASCRERV